MRKVLDFVCEKWNACEAKVCCLSLSLFSHFLFKDKVHRNILASFFFIGMMLQ